MGRQRSEPNDIAWFDRNWFVPATLPLMTAFLFYNHKSWHWVGFTTIVVSQLITILSWSEMKHVTWINMFFPLVLIPALCDDRFQKKIKQDVQQHIESQKTNLHDPTCAQQIPPIVERWIQNSGIRELPPFSRVKLKQKGDLRTSPTAAWMPFEAEQWFSVKDPAFIWKARVEMIWPLFLSGHDRFLAGKGAMDISLASMIPVVSVKNDAKLDQASMIRYLAEICWFPSAASEPYIFWESQGDLTAKADFTYKCKSVSGKFTFNEEADLVSFEAWRFKDAGQNARKVRWVVRNMAFSVLNNVRIPSYSKVSWDLQEGEFHWLNVEIIDISYE